MRVTYVVLFAGAVFAVYINGVAEGWWPAWGKRPTAATTPPTARPVPTDSASASGEAAMSGGYHIGPNDVLVRPAEHAASTYTLNYEKPLIPRVPRGSRGWVGRADGGSGQMVVAVVVVLDDSSTEGIVSCARVVVGAVGAFRGEAAFEGFAHRFGQERPSDGVGRRESVRVECGDAWRRPVVGGEDTELLIGETS